MTEGNRTARTRPDLRRFHVDSISFYFGAGGRFAGAEGADSVAMTFTIPAVGQSVPVYQIGRYQLRETPPESTDQ